MDPDLAPRSTPDINATRENGSDGGSSAESQREESSPPLLQTRRAHRKSKLGCVVCKRRRVKCDETRPSCNRCRAYGVDCVYPQTHDSKNTELEEITGVPLNYDAFSMMLASAAESIESSTRSSSPGSGVYSSLTRRENLEAVQRFELFTLHTLGDPLTRQVVRNKVLPLVFQSPHLMHAVIAASITHLRQVNPAYVPHTSDGHHWQRALALFQKELGSPGTRNGRAMDLMLSTSMLLTIHSFTVEGDAPEGSWLLSSSYQNSNWFVVNGGLDAIVDMFGGDRTQTVWYPVMKDGDDFQVTSSYRAPSAWGIPAGFLGLCELDEESTAENNPYHAPLRALSLLLGLEASQAMFSKLVSFVGHIKGEYRELVKAKDPRALLVFSYWLAQMSRVDIWWMQTRMQFECRAICAHLERHAADPRILELLEFPALASGYRDASGAVINRPPLECDVETCPELSSGA